MKHMNNCIIFYIRKAASVLQNPDEMLNKWQQGEITQGRVNSNIAQLTAEITKIKESALQVFLYFP